MSQRRLILLDSSFGALRSAWDQFCDLNELSRRDRKESVLEIVVKVSADSTSLMLSSLSALLRNENETILLTLTKESLVVPLG
jgi:hypothetical protein